MEPEIELKSKTPVTVPHGIKVMLLEDLIMFLILDSETLKLEGIHKARTEVSCDDLAYYVSVYSLPLHPHDNEDLIESFRFMKVAVASPEVA